MSALSWNEIRARAAVFAREWRDAGYEKGQTHLFYQEFFQLFGMSVRRLASFEEPVKKLGNRQGFIDLFWKGMLLVEQKSAGRSLIQAKEQALDYFPALAQAELPRYLLLCDFQHFALHDLEQGSAVQFTLAQLPQHVQAFAFIRGDVQEALIAQEQVTIGAAERIGTLHDLLAADGFGGEELQLFLIRLVFCLFADDTGIFERRASFLALLKNRSAVDGSDMGGWLQRLFQTLNTPENQRQKSLDEELAQFPYINGALFAGLTRIPSFNRAMREALIAACEFDWKAVSPAIFGSLFQSVMERRQRRQQGAHYTSEKHILRLIQPLFLDELNSALDKICALKRGKIQALQRFHEKLAGLTFLDPACGCGCGNFLVVAYQHIRQLETRLLQELHKGDARLHLDVSHLSRIDVDHFYGIELGAFAAKIAQIALWMTDHLCNLELSAAFGQHFARIPLDKTPGIHHADALEIDWHAVLPAQKCRYVLGNPPFVGKLFQSPRQAAQIKTIAAAAGLHNGAGALDYVCAWFLKAAEYTHVGRQAQSAPPQIAFVATNSITQGEQIARLWPLLFSHYPMEIAFAHRSFAWSSEARGMAHVHVVIVGLAARGFEPKEKILFHYENPKAEPHPDRHKMLSPYLIGADALGNPYLVIASRNTPLNGAPHLKTGVQMIDNGIYTFSAAEKDDFLRAEPAAAPFFRQFIGGDEYINGHHRWILYLAHISPAALRQLPLVVKRVEAVRAFRAQSGRASTRLMAQTPTRLGVDERLSRPFLVIPNTSSEHRDYIPIGWLGQKVIANQKLRILPDAALWHFAILTSRMHMAWMRQVTGRLESRYMYSVGVVYNTFPWPQDLPQNSAAQEKLAPLAQCILDIRAAHAGCTLADLYHRTSMPPDLRKAHAALDHAVDKLYRSAPFKDDAERVALLFARYEALLAPPLHRP